MNQVITTSDVIVNLTEKELSNLSDDAKEWFEWIGQYDKSQLQYLRALHKTPQASATLLIEMVLKSSPALIVFLLL